ncbi:hypothetical protein PAXRUDRAFT_172338, partial [Paxillus rubicundulus Ve08.2h10]
LPTCAICLSTDPHPMPVIKCPAEKMLDGKHGMFTKQSNQSLLTKSTGQCICMLWQQHNSCTECHS